MPTTNPFTDEVRDTQSLSGVNTDGSGDVTVTFDTLRQIDDAASVSVQADGGYVANVQSVTGNEATVRLFESAGSAAALSAVTGGSGVTDLYAEATGF